MIMPVVARIKVSGLENIPKKTSVIYIANHQSFLDIPTLMSLLPGSFRFIVSKDYFSFPVFGGFTARSGHLPINREAAGEAHKTLFKATELLKGGKSLVVFPEGTRSHDGRLGKFKRGAFTIAFETGTAVVPIAISGSYKIMHRKSYFIQPGKIEVKIGRPINLKEGKPNKEIYETTAQFVRGEIEKMLA